MADSLLAFLDDHGIAPVAIDRHRTGGAAIVIGDERGRRRRVYWCVAVPRLLSSWKRGWTAVDLKRYTPSKARAWARRMRGMYFYWRPEDAP